MSDFDIGLNWVSIMDTQAHVLCMDIFLNIGKDFLFEYIKVTLFLNEVILLDKTYHLKNILKNFL